MAPIRRYLRITKYSVLECRIYLDNPALAQSWLLRPRDPVLPRVIESVRPLVLPKLREERERARKKGTKKKGAIRDVLVEDDFEVALFLTETDTRHSLLYKHRQARDKTQTRLVSNSHKLTGASRDAPVDVDDGGGGGAANGLRVELGPDVPPALDTDEDDVVLTSASIGITDGETDTTRVSDPAPPNLLREETDDGDDTASLALRDIPDIRAETAGGNESSGAGARRRSKRRRSDAVRQVDDDEGKEEHGGGEDNDDDDSLFASSNHSGDEDEDGDNGNGPPAKRLRPDGGGVGGDDKKKKLAMDVVYEGFAIYGRVLCLVVKQRRPPRPGRSTIPSMLASPLSGSTPSTAAAGAHTGGRAAASPAVSKPAGLASMENWIASTQMPAEATDMDVP
ncbi:hypothetical protein SPI_08404 [Niveomyces insectorum RCEF 264]|uniref:Uncharacterized protein n=1 Tax=Niveomyces insectorum RCEF 264 TaxID=1081102 RepID=A0A167NA00_9HYPO|nr:hypothetical protein SPI_08404 [Niveomyces insectorum RCEF 264]